MRAHVITLPRGDMQSHKNRLAQFPLAVLADHVAVDNRCFQVKQWNDTELAGL